MTTLSFFARTGIQEQTASKPNETDTEGCVKGWGQAACSNRVLDEKHGVDKQQLERFIDHLQSLAKELETTEHRITDKVLAAFISTQNFEPYSTH
jgi:hypothetical protein